MNANARDLTLTSLDTVTIFDLASGSYKFSLDELQTVTISQSEETTEITGRQGRRLNTLKRNKALTISGTNGMVSGGLLAQQTGGEFERNVVTTVLWPDYTAVVNKNAATTEYVAVGTLGNEIKELYLKDSEGVLTKKYEQAPEASADHFAYDPATRTITFAEGEVEDGTELSIWYERRIKGDRLENNSEAYTTKCKMYIDGTAEDACGNVFHIQFYMPKVDFSGNFELQMGDAQTVHAFEASSMAGACGTAGSFFTYTIFGAQAEDYVSGDEHVTVLSGEDEVPQYGSKKASDLMEADVSVEWDGLNGTVTGTFKKVDNWTELPGSGDNSGHFFAFTIDNKYLGKPFTYKNETKGTSSTKPSAEEDEMSWVLKIDETKKVSFWSGEDLIVAYDFTNAKLA